MHESGNSIQRLLISVQSPEFISKIHNHSMHRAAFADFIAYSQRCLAEAACSRENKRSFNADRKTSNLNPARSAVKGPCALQNCCLCSFHVFHLHHSFRPLPAGDFSANYPRCSDFLPSCSCFPAVHHMSAVFFIGHVYSVCRLHRSAI